VTEFPYTMFCIYLSFTLCICLTVQVTASVTYADPNEQHPLDVQDLEITSLQNQVASQSLDDINVDIIEKEERTVNPHGDPTQCISCHTSDEGGRDTFVNGANISQLCQSCHDGERATKETHPVDVVPISAAEMKIPSDLPLFDGLVTCLSCHDVVSKCKTEETDANGNHNFLRVDNVSRPLELCFHCHEQQKYEPFNVHDQLEAGEVKSDTCLWCHSGVPEVSGEYKEDASYALRGRSSGICNNCHQMTDNHPNNVLHLYSVPSDEMIWCMATSEMMPRMRIPFKDLYRYVSGAKRRPRSIPLDKSGRIACYSCHNPHEKGLFPDSNPRSLGAEAKQAKNYRFRTHQGNICQACHYK